MLSDDLISWFDDGIWETVAGIRDSTGGANSDRFLTAVPPTELLADAPAEIWPALMPCDFLPILGNGVGDWLCIRFDSDNRSGDVVHWYHGGGDWIPWGASLAAAVVYDSVRSRLPGAGRDHAVSPQSDGDPPVPDSDPLDRWASQFLARSAVATFDSLSGTPLAEAMLEHRISEPAVLCGMVIHALDNPLIEPILEPLFDAHHQPASSGESDRLQRVLFDNRLVETSLLAQSGVDDHAIAQALDRQDWQTVRRCCRRSCDVAPELAWGWDLLGYSHERTGETAAAVECYRHGLQCSVFTDQTVRVRTHGFHGEGQKFSASRLFGLGYQPDDPLEQEYWECLAARSPEERRERVREYFSKRAGRANSADAHGYWIRAGWDLGAEPMLAFAELLEHVAQTARDAGRVAQSQLARTHRKCFLDRYGI